MIITGISIGSVGMGEKKRLGNAGLPNLLFSLVDPQVLKIELKARKVTQFKIALKV